MTTREALFALLRISITGEADNKLDFTGIDWRELLNLVVRQGVLGVVWNGLEIQSRDSVLAIGVADKMLWLGMVRKSQGEMDNKRKLIEEFAQLISPMPCVVLKGFDYARYWPLMNYRVFGDLDIWSCGNQNEINRVVKEAGGEVEEEGGKHNELYYRGLRVENHRYFVSEGKSIRDQQVESLLCDVIGKSYTHIDGGQALSPNRNFSVLMMLKHMQNHFLYEGIRLRLVLDWLFFMREEREKIDWDIVSPAMKILGITRLSHLLTQYCDAIEGKIEKNRRLEQFEELFFEPEMDRRLSFIPSVIRVFKRCVKRWTWRDIL